MSNSIYNSFKPTDLVLKVGGVIIPTNNISVCVVREWIFDIVPRLEVIFQDVYNITEVNKLKAFDEVELTMKYDVGSKPNVSLKFVIVTIDITNTGIGVPIKIVQLTALSGSKSFFSDFRSKSFGKTSSVEVIKSVYKTNSIPYQDEGLTTSDNMLWLQCSTSDVDFIKHVRDRTYKTDDDCIYAYLDRKGKGHISSLKTKATVNPTMSFKYVTTLLPEPEQVSHVSFNGFSYKDFMGISTLSEDIADSVIQVDEDGSTKQTNIYDVATKLNFISGNPMVFRDNPSFVKNTFQPRDSGNTYEQYYINKTRRKFVERMFFSTMVVVSGLPHSKINLMDTVNLEIPVPKSNTGSISKMYSGKYLVGGMIHQLIGTNMYQCSYALFRNEDMKK